MTRRIAIVGGGMAGLAAAWRLSGADDADLEITLYESSGILGGKGASVRGPHGRIEEHGLHVWLGYYDNSFRLMREVYDELDRPRVRPDCPIASIDDAFHKASRVGVMEHGPNGWSPWLSHFAENDEVPGSSESPPLDVRRFIMRGIQLLGDALGSLDARPSFGGVHVTATSSLPPGADMVAAAAKSLRATELASIGLLANVTAQLPEVGEGQLREIVDGFESLVQRRLEGDDTNARAAILVDLILTCLRGLVTDGGPGSPLGWPQLDDEDFGEWLRRHGARASSVDSGLVRGMYDLVFAYEGGDPERRSFPAGLGLFLTGKIFFDYKGAIFWKMQAGMGDVVMAPLHEALEKRGVRIEYFHETTNVALRGHRVTEVTMLSRTSTDRYRPLRDVAGLPCFTADAVEEHLAETSPEEHTLRVGHDFDDVVLACPVGVVGEIATELVAELPAWRRMVDDVQSVSTWAAQLWFDRPERELAPSLDGATVSGFSEPFDTYASMSHLLSTEQWDHDGPAGLAYLCSVRPPGGETIEHELSRFWHRRSASLLPGAWLGDAVDPEALDLSDVDRVYVRENSRPTDRYTQSIVGSAAARMRPGDTGVDNLVLAGDGTDCGLNAGCIEAAVLSGLQAANALLGRPQSDGLLGSWPGLDQSESGS